MCTVSFLIMDFVSLNEFKFKLLVGATRSLERFSGSRQSGAEQGAVRGLENAINGELNSYISQPVSTI